MPNDIPDRWLHYTAVGKRIENTPFVAFKCPLNQNLLRKIPAAERFGPDELRTLLPNVSLVIDLTNSDRYYNGDDLRSIGIEHEKIKVPGHVTPSKHLLRKFFLVVDNFRARNDSDPEKLIGVHCTHGVNRTGFFICSYMISKMKFPFELAVTEFSAARGHNIERDNYLQQLEMYQMWPLEFTFGPADFLTLRKTNTRVKKRKQNSAQNQQIPSLMSRTMPSYVSHANYPPQCNQYAHNQQTWFVNANHNQYGNHCPPGFANRNSNQNGNHNFPTRQQSVFVNSNYYHRNSAIPPPLAFPTEFGFNGRRNRWNRKKSKEVKSSSQNS